MNKEIYNSWMVNKYIAHRGLHNDFVPENSLEAFKEAIIKGYPFEMDVQMSSDGVLYVFHDRNMKRMTGLDKNIDEITSEEINTLKLANSSSHVPTMEEMLKMVNGLTPILIEIKDHKNIGELEEKLTKMLKAYKGEFSVQSFNPFIVKWFKKHAPEFVRGQLSCGYVKDGTLGFCKRMLLKYMVFLRSNGSQFVSYDYNDIKRKQLKRIKKRMPVLMWTTRSQEQMKECEGYYDNIIFEKFIPE